MRVGVSMCAQGRAVCEGPSGGSAQEGGDKRVCSLRDLMRGPKAMGPVGAGASSVGSELASGTLPRPQGASTRAEPSCCPTLPEVQREGKALYQQSGKQTWKPRRCLLRCRLGPAWSWDSRRAGGRQSTGADANSLSPGLL